MSNRKEISNVQFEFKKFSIYMFYKSCLDNLYELFYYMIKDSTTGFWWESLTLISEYLQLIIYIIDEKVSL
jgi:hypothetical protein